MDTRGNSEEARRARYSAAYDRAAQAIIRQLRHDPRRFASFLKRDLDLNHAFQTPDELAKAIAYDFRKEKVDATAMRQTNLALALHQLWKDHHDGKAQTGQERAIALWLGGLVEAEIDEKAEQEAEREIAA